MWRDGATSSLIDVPLDARLFEDLQQRMGVQFLGAGGGRPPRRHGLRIDIDDATRRAATEATPRAARG